MYFKLLKVVAESILSIYMTLMSMKLVVAPDMKDTKSGYTKAFVTKRSNFIFKTIKLSTFILSTYSNCLYENVLQ